MIGKRLKFGDTIGIISPASPESYDKIQQSISVISDLGFKVKTGNHVYDKLGHLAGTDKSRADDIMDAFLDDNIDMILCMRGGYGTMRLLPYLQFDVIMQNPKIFIGYSDITTLLNSFSSKSSLITFHGPMLTSDWSNENTIDSFLFTLMEGTHPFCIENPFDTPLISNTDAEVQGELVGGNLSLICSTIGTPYEINTENKILFIEEVGEEPYAVDRMLTHLLLANKLQRCKGLLLGQFTDCTLPHYERSLTLDEVLQDRLFSMNKPILSNFMTGHGNPKLTLPIGANINLDCKNRKIHVLEAVVS